MRKNILLLCILFCCTNSSLLFQYGKHYPNGQAAVEYIYGENGMWRNFTPAQYIWNYYDYSNLPTDHPFNISALIQYSSGDHVTTCLDANEHLLLDFNHDGEIDTTDGGFSFHEHSGRGDGDELRGLAFNNFWFDDNSLCRFMSSAYNMPLPNGLSEYSDFTRWQIVGGDAANWTPYPGDQQYIDQLALNGLYYITQNDYSTAISKWKGIYTIAQPTWDASNQQFDYPGVNANYYLGLFAILTNFLRFMATDAGEQHQLLQHSISIRSSIITNQVVSTSTGTLCSWCTNIPNGGSLQNAESTATNALGLGAASLHSFEVGSAPLLHSGSFYLRPYHALSAVTGLSQPGYLSYGPYWNYPTGTYTVEFVLRSPAATGSMVTLDVNDENSTTVLASQTIDASQFTSNDWIPFQLNFNIINPNNEMEFRIYWGGTANMDACVIHIW